jgi:hypothetical protein
MYLSEKNCGSVSMARVSSARLPRSLVTTRQPSNAKQQASTSKQSSSAFVLCAYRRTSCRSGYPYQQNVKHPSESVLLTGTQKDIALSVTSTDAFVNRATRIFSKRVMLASASFAVPAMANTSTSDDRNAVRKCTCATRRENRPYGNAP